MLKSDISKTYITQNVRDIILMSIFYNIHVFFYSFKHKDTSPSPPHFKAHCL